jgi:lipoteichoic acid synthase
MVYTVNDGYHRVARKGALTLDCENCVMDQKPFADREKALRILFFPAAIFFQETVLKFACFKEIPFSSHIYTALFSLAAGLGIYFLAGLFDRPFNKILAFAFNFAIFLLIGAQIVYFQIFSTFGTLYSLFTGPEAIAQFRDATMAGIQSGLIYILLCMVPLILLIVFRRKIIPEKHRSAKESITVVLAAAVSHILCVALISANTAGVLSVSYLYREAFIPNLSVANFGVITTLRLDAKYLITGHPEKLQEDHEGRGEERPDAEAPNEGLAYNIVDIDFDALIEQERNDAVRGMHEYFKSIPPTEKNVYTGMFKGKNLIWLVGEAFSTLAINKSVTPTLYRLSNEGFVFNNFYNPVWSVSTSDGEYVTLTGLIPKSGVWSFKRSSRNHMPYGFGNMLTPLGYTCKAYHNHFASYYGRNESHPNLGYKYVGKGSELALKGTWPESDLEMMQLTIPGDMQNNPFHTYYMTVSGHLNYTFGGNYIAAKNREVVSHLPYSEACRAYLACNVELDRAIEFIIDELEAAGKLDDTVIVLSGDHYPYGLKDGEMDELAGYELEKKFEKYKSTLILWNSGMEAPVYVDKVCSSLDVLPTIANLMGLEYDSRLITGKDILAPSPGIAYFNNRSWISDVGRYDTSTNKFTANPGVSVDEEYARNTQKEVNKAFEHAVKILDYNYYSIVLPEGFRNTGGTPSEQ